MLHRQPCPCKLLLLRPQNRPRLRSKRFPRLVASLCRRLARALFTRRRRPFPFRSVRQPAQLRPPEAPEASSAAVPFSIAARPVAPADVPALDSIRRVELQEGLEPAGPCIRPEASLADRRQARVRALASAPVVVQVLASVLAVRGQALDSFRLPVRHRVHSVRDRTRAVVASSIRRLKKAR